MLTSRLAMLTTRTCAAFLLLMTAVTHAMAEADGWGEEHAELLGDQPELHCDTTNANRNMMAAAARATLEGTHFSVEAGYFGFNGTGSGDNPAAANPGSSCASAIRFCARRA